MNKKLTLSFFIGSIAFSLSLYRTGPKGHVTYDPVTGQGTISSKSGTTVGTIDYNKETHTGTLTGPYGGQADLTGDSYYGDDLQISNGPYGGSAYIYYIPNQDLSVSVSNPSNNAYGYINYSIPYGTIQDFTVSNSKGLITKDDEVSAYDKATHFL